MEELCTAAWLCPTPASDPGATFPGPFPSLDSSFITTEMRGLAQVISKSLLLMKNLQMQNILSQSLTHFMYPWKEQSHFTGDGNYLYIEPYE